MIPAGAILNTPNVNIPWIQTDDCGLMLRMDAFEDPTCYSGIAVVLLSLRGKGIILQVITCHLESQWAHQQLASLNVIMSQVPLVV